MRSNTDIPRVYIACLAAYNAGHLHGAWHDVTSEDGLNEAIAEVIRTSPVRDAEEHAFHDHECLPTVGEYSSVDEVVAIADLVLEYGVGATAAALDRGGDADDAREALEDRYHGEWNSFLAYVEDYIDGTGMLNSIPEHLRGYFNEAAYARDMEHGYHTFTDSAGMVHVFDA